MKNVFIALALILTTSTAFAADVTCSINGKKKRISNCRMNSASIMCINEGGFLVDQVTYTMLRRDGAGTFEVNESTVFFASDLLRKQETFAPTLKNVKCVITVNGKK